MTTPTSPTIVIERFFEADAATLYRAWTDPEVMARWFFVGEGWHAAVDSDAKVGGRYRLTMTTADDERHTMHGEYLELEPDRKIRFTWTSHVVEDSRVTIELEPRDGGTLLRLSHELIPDPDARDAHRLGWAGCLENLARHLAG